MRWLTISHIITFETVLCSYNSQHAIQSRDVLVIRAGLHPL
jgi:hypothetical protein